MSIFDSGLRFEYERVKPNLLAVLQFERDGGERILAPDGCRMDEDRLSVNAKRIFAFERSMIGRRCPYEIYVYRDGTTGAGII